MNFVEYSSEYIPLINKKIKEILEKSILTAKDNFLKKYYSEIKNYILAGGKRIRPLLTIASYNAFSNEKDESILVPCVGLEFLHNASLVHDDIIDRDDFRRGEPSFHSRFKEYHSNLYSSNVIESSDFGNSVGIIGGDTTFFLGLEAYLNNDFEVERNLSAIKLYKEAFLEIADGVLIEMDMVRKKKIDISDYIQMISLKTSTLIEKALLIGCNYAETEQNNKILFSNYGMNLGRVFQIIDDILGTFGDENATGKPTDGDIREGKKTCLLITSLNTLEGHKKKKLNNLVGKKDITENEVEQVKDLFKEANADNMCKNMAQKYYEDALQSLENLKNAINGSEYEFFESILNFVIKRNY